VRPAAISCSHSAILFFSQLMRCSRVMSLLLFKAHQYRYPRQTWGASPTFRLARHSDRLSGRAERNARDYGQFETGLAELMLRHIAAQNVSQIHALHSEIQVSPATRLDAVLHCGSYERVQVDHCAFERNGDLVTVVGVFAIRGLPLGGDDGTVAGSLLLGFLNFGFRIFGFSFGHWSVLLLAFSSAGQGPPAHRTGLRPFRRSAFPIWASEINYRGHDRNCNDDKEG
jgi:hypothetical protein